MSDTNETNDTNETDMFTFNEDGVNDVTADGQPGATEEVCAKAAHCPLKHHPGLCGKGGKCPVKNLSKEDVIAGAVTLAAMAALTVATYYLQFAITKAAVKSALKETRLR